MEDLEQNYHCSKKNPIYRTAGTNPLLPSEQALVGGLPQDALVDLTGAIGEMIRLKDKLPNPDLLWKQMLTSNDDELGVLLTAGIFAPRNSTSEREVC